MKPSIATCLTAATLCAVLVGAAQPAVQARQNYPYVLIDAGTFGGLQSYLDQPGVAISDGGTFIGSADTPTPDSNTTNCFNPDCLVSPGFQWRAGVRTKVVSLPGGASNAPFSINAYGLMAGISENGVIDTSTGLTELRAVVWHDGAIRELGTLGGAQSFTTSLNDQGLVVGWALNTTPDPYSKFVSGGGRGTTQSRAVAWIGGRPLDLGTLGGSDADAVYVNNLGEITGQSLTNATPISSNGGSPNMDPFFWHNGKMQDLGTLGGNSGVPNAMNNWGDVIGQSNLAGNAVYQPFLWSRGSLKNLGTLGGDYGSANGINDLRQVVGWAQTTSDATVHPVLWSNGTTRDLGVPPGDDYGFGNSINMAGVIVGSAGAFNAPQQHGALWVNGSSFDLNTLVAPTALHITWGAYINNRGEIAGEAVLPNGNVRAVILIPAGEANAEQLVQNTPPPITNAETILPHAGTAACPSLATWLGQTKRASQEGRPIRSSWPACLSG